MMLSKNFKAQEFACHCCDKQPEGGMNPKLIDLLQAIRDKIEKPIVIVSGYRCEKNNKRIGGAKHSQHVLGNAADIKVIGMSAHAVHEYLSSHFNQRCKGLGRYVNFTHIDVREGDPSRWNR